MLDIHHHDADGHGAVRVARMQHPPANALDPELLAALDQEVRQAPDSGARAWVLAGQPGMFSAGLDVPRLLQLDRPALQEAFGCFFSVMHALAASPIPTAAAITGHSPAGGAVLSLFCDYRVMAEGPFKIGLNETRVGLAVPRLIFDAFARLVGPRHAERLAVPGALIPPEEALAVGMVDEVAPPAEVEARAVARCGALLALPPTAVARTRQMAREDLIASFENFPEQAPDFVDAWFEDETQGALKAMVAALAAKSA